MRDTEKKKLYIDSCGTSNRKYLVRRPSTRITAQEIQRKKDDCENSLIFRSENLTETKKSFYENRNIFQSNTRSSHPGTNQCLSKSNEIRSQIFLASKKVTSTQTTSTQTRIEQLKRNLAIVDEKTTCDDIEGEEEREYQLSLLGASILDSDTIHSKLERLKEKKHTTTSQSICDTIFRDKKDEGKSIRPKSNASKLIGVSFRKNKNDIQTSEVVLKPEMERRKGFILQQRNKSRTNEKKRWGFSDKEEVLSLAEVGGGKTSTFPKRNARKISNSIQSQLVAGTDAGGLSSNPNNKASSTVTAVNDNVIDMGVIPSPFQDNSIAQEGIVVSSSICPSDEEKFPYSCQSKADYSCFDRKTSSKLKLKRFRSEPTKCNDIQLKESLNSCSQGLENTEVPSDKETLYLPSKFKGNMTIQEKAASFQSTESGSLKLEKDKEYGKVENFIEGAANNNPGSFSIISNSDESNDGKNRQTVHSLSKQTDSMNKKAKKVCFQAAYLGSSKMKKAKELDTERCLEEVVHYNPGSFSMISLSGDSCDKNLHLPSRQTDNIHELVKKFSSQDSSSSSSKRENAREFGDVKKSLGEAADYKLENVSLISLSEDSYEQIMYLKAKQTEMTSKKEKRGLKKKSFRSIRAGLGLNKMRRSISHLFRKKSSVDCTEVNDSDLKPALKFYITDSGSIQMKTEELSNTGEDLDALNENLQSFSTASLSDSSHNEGTLQLPFNATDKKKKQIKIRTGLEKIKKLRKGISHFFEKREKNTLSDNTKPRDSQLEPQIDFQATEEELMILGRNEKAEQRCEKIRKSLANSSHKKVEIAAADKLDNIKTETNIEAIDSGLVIKRLLSMEKDLEEATKNNIGSLPVTNLAPDNSYEGVDRMCVVEKTDEKNYSKIDLNGKYDELNKNNCIEQESIAMIMSTDIVKKEVGSCQNDCFFNYIENYTCASTLKEKNSCQLEERGGNSGTNSFKNKKSNSNDRLNNTKIKTKYHDGEKSEADNFEVSSEDGLCLASGIRSKVNGESTTETDMVQITEPKLSTETQKNDVEGEVEQLQIAQMPEYKVKAFESFEKYVKNEKLENSFDSLDKKGSYLSTYGNVVNNIFLCGDLVEDEHHPCTDCSLNCFQPSKYEIFSYHAKKNKPASMSKWQDQLNTAALLWKNSSDTFPSKKDRLMSQLKKKVSRKKGISSGNSSCFQTDVFDDKTGPNEIRDDIICPPLSRSCAIRHKKYIRSKGAQDWLNNSTCSFSSTEIDFSGESSDSAHDNNRMNAYQNYA